MQTLIKKVVPSYIFWMVVLFSTVPLVAQDKLQKELDSLEAVFFSLDKKDTTRMLELGTYIVENTPSEKQRYKILQKISESYFRANNIDKSIAYLFRAKEVAEKVGEPELMAQAYGSIANQYSYLNLTEKARLYLDQAIEQIERLPAGKDKHRLKALSYIELGKLDFNNGDFASANQNYRKSLEEFNRIDHLEHRYHYRRSLYNIGNSYYYMEQPDSAETYLKRALALKEPESPGLKFYIYSTLSEVYAFKGNPRRSIDTLQAVINDPAFDIPTLKAEMYLNLAKNYKALGDDANYGLYTEKYLALRETLKGEELSAITTAFNIEQKDYISSISASRQRNRWLFIGIVVIVLASLGSFMYLYRRRKKERTIYKSIIKKLESQVMAFDEAEHATEEEAQPGHSIPVSVEKDIWEKLKRFEQAEKFRNPKLTLSTMAVQLKTNPTYLSTIIKTQTQKNFNAYINELRIRYICETIHKHPEYLNYKISYLAETSGFNSHSTFTTVFKNVTGISPSVFLREEEKEHRAK